MSQVTVIPPHGGELIADTPARRVEILSERAPLHATITRFAPGEQGSSLHVHREHTDLFYVIEGELTVRLGTEDRQVPVPAGALALVPPYVVHGFRNASAADELHLNFHAPGTGFADYMRGLRDGAPFPFDQYEPPADGGRPLSEAVVTHGTPAGDGVELLAELPAIRVTRVRGSAEHAAAASYYVLEGDLKLTAGAEETWAPAGAWVHAEGEHVADGTFLRITT